MTVRRRAIARTGVNGAAEGHVLMEMDYPESDGKPMAETPTHRDVMTVLIAMLREFFAARHDVYVSGNMMLYYEEGNIRASVSPDVFVTVGIPKLPERRVYFLWREGRPPTFVIEATSRSTRRQDLVVKRDLYARLGVAEYVQFDPLAEYLRPPLQGYRLVNGVYQPMLPDPDGALYSAVLGLRLAVAGGLLRFFHPVTGIMLPTPEDRVDAARSDARAARLEAEVAQLQAQVAHQAIEIERLRAEAAESQLLIERARTAELQARIAELERRERGD